jgi:hypothetical protein
MMVMMMMMMMMMKSLLPIGTKKGLPIGTWTPYSTNKRPPPIGGVSYRKLIGGGVVSYREQIFVPPMQQASHHYLLCH